MHVRACGVADQDTILAVINDAAQAYRGVIPPDRWHEPYLSPGELRQEIADGVRFWGIGPEVGALLGVMGIQDRGEVTLIRHAYVRTAHRSRGLGTRLLHALEAQTEKPILMGTWLAATWAIAFYERHGYRRLGRDESTALLHRYWHLPERQIETSLVLANARWVSA